MYCPRCSAQTPDETNFCSKCGLTLRPGALAPSRDTNEGFDWSKTWVVDMLLSDDERMRRRAAAQIADGPEGTTLLEMKRAKEVKGGIITMFVGIGLSIFLWFFLGAIADSVVLRNPEGANILRHIWAVGIIPFVVGLGIILSALLVDTNALRLSQAAIRAKLMRVAGGPSTPRTTNELPSLEAPPSVVSSVTESTTNLLSEPASVPRNASKARQ